MMLVQPELEVRSDSGRTELTGFKATALVPVCCDNSFAEVLMRVLSRRPCNDTWKLDTPVCNLSGVTRPVTPKVLAPSAEEKGNNIRHREEDSFGLG